MSWYFIVALLLTIFVAVSDLSEQRPWWRWLMWMLFVCVIEAGSILEYLVTRSP